MKNPSKMETRETKGRKLQTETVFRPRDERSPFICHLSFAFDSPVSPPLLFPRAGIVLSSTRIPKERSALVRDPDRSFWRENRCNTRKRFGQFNPLKRMARRREKVGARSRKRPTLVWQPPSSSSSSFLSTLPDSSNVFLASSSLSLSLRKEGRVSVFFPNDKTKRERSFFCSTSATPSFLHLDPGSFFETREISLSSNIRVDRFFFQRFEILKRNKYRNWD